MEYKFILDQDLVDEYNKVYFKKNPRAKKPFLTKPRHPTLNEWTIMRRPFANALKQRWKEFGVWWCKKLGYDGLMLDRVKVSITVYQPHHRRGDIDNFCTMKFLWDAFTEAKFWVDDDYTHVTEIVSRMDYDKDNPRTEIIVRTVDK